MPADGAMCLAGGRGTTVVAVAQRLTFTQQPRATAVDAVPVTLIAIGPIGAAAHTIGRAGEAAITTALPATAALVGTHTIRVVDSEKAVEHKPHKRLVSLAW